MLPIVRLSIADQVYERLRSQIVTGEIPSGSLLSIDDISRQIENTSKTPVRDALNRLRGEGLVVGTGAGKLQVVKLMPDQITQICELRCALEILGLKWGFDNLCRAKLDKTLSTLLGIREDIRQGRLENWDRDDIEFHATIISASENLWLVRIYSQLSDLINITRHMFRSTERHKQSCEEHIAIVDALLEKDLESSTRLLTAHIESLEQYLLSSCSQSAVGEGRLRI
jgi:DNA-binding GntR family transcriptional regulator